MRIGRWMMVGAIVLGGPTIAAAQAKSGDMVWGVLGGMNLATASGGDITSPSNRVGFTLGAFARWAIDETWAFHTELDYVAKGVKFTEGGTGGGTGNLGLNYVEVPLFVRVAAGDPSMKWFGEAGPALAFKVGCSASLTQNGASQSVDCAQLTTFNSFDYGLALGGGVEIPMGDYGLSIGARYTYGMRNLSSETGTNGSPKSRNLQFLAAVRF